MKKSIIETYKNDTYFVDLVVANEHTTLKELRKLYMFSDKVELNEEILSGDCTTSTCIRKADDRFVILIKYNHANTCKSIDKKVDLINTVSHEATHVALDIYENIHQNVCFCSPEPFCYLVGWAAECIYKTLTKKSK